MGSLTVSMPVRDVEKVSTSNIFSIIKVVSRVPLVPHDCLDVEVV